MIPKIIRPFPELVFTDLQRHTTEIRRVFDWPGVPLHDAKDLPADRMNRWYWHNLPLLKKLHHSMELRKVADEVFGEPVKPSYVFLSMYGPDGVVPLHQDRPQCYRTIDLQLDSDGTWPIYVDDKPYTLKPGQALCYSGTGQPHFRKPMPEDSQNHKKTGPISFMNLAFFHYVPIGWQGALD